MNNLHVVTGANGYLGSHLVLNLLLASATDRIVCIARADAGSARQRVLDALAVAAQTSGCLLNAQLLARIEVVDANPLVANPGLGEQISGATSDVRGRRVFWHVAATVRFVENEVGELARINTEGALNALELASAAGCTDFNYISTAYVAGDRSGQILERLEADAPDAFSNPYESSKFNAERRVVARAKDLAMAWRVFRPSVIVGHSRTGLSASDSGIYKFCEMLDQYWSGLKSDPLSNRSLRVLAPESAAVNLVPVDVCVDEMLAVDAHPESCNRIFHLVSADTVSTVEVCAAMAMATGAPIAAVTPTLLASAPLSRREIEFARRTAHYQPYLCGSKHFDRTEVIRFCGRDLQAGVRIDSASIFGWLQSFLKRRRGLLEATTEAKLFTRQRGLPAQFNIAEHLIASSRAYPGKPALRQGDRSITYAELGQQVAACVRRLSTAGVHCHARVALVGHDSIEHTIALLSVMHLGAVCTLINPLLSAEDIELALGQSDATCCIADTATAGKVGGSGVDLLALEPLTAADTQGWLPLASATSPLDIAFATFTSGSTGKPKLIEHRHQDPLVAADRYAAHLLDLRASDVLFSASRTTFAFGLQNLLIALLKGATAVFAPVRISAAVVADIIATARPTVMFAVPTIYQYLLDDRVLSERIEGNNLRLCIAAGERLPQAVAANWFQRHGVRLLDSLGSTEAFSTYLSNVADVEQQGATGKLVPGFDAVLRHLDGSPCRNGERGIMWLRGPSLSVSAHDRAAGGRLKRGWYCTNDVFWRDADGYFYFCGRSDEMFKVAGQWISPLDLEDVLLTHPLVREAAITASDDGQGTLRTKAWVVADRPSPELADELRALCKSRLDGRRYPSLVEFVSELPRTSTGKLQRAPLRQRAGELSAAAIA